ncbi:Uma2 family endonuclease [Cytobacillus massiliigabonensis]|uniref:Uma2 family endonuclease n=1 Tax=Cytobacillus massiliigabonensis TaxID=1871011 RepID=UPI000C840E66|nr:Uma2 family endonuclease [Cytobacillus massiliigabonensis]
MGEGSKKNADKVKEDVLTYDDYAAIDDGNRYELAGGQLELMSPAPLVTHQIVSFEMQKAIALSCESDYLILYAPVDVILSQTEVRQPDLVLIHRKRIEIISKRGIEGAPDLVIEILSPSTLKRDKIDKIKSYAHFGIPEFWIVDPEAGFLEQYVLHENRYELIDIFQNNELVTSPNIPCVSFTMAAIMDKIPPLSD